MVMKKFLTGISTIMLALSLSVTIAGCTPSGNETGSNTVQVSEDVYSAESATDMAITIPIPGESGAEPASSGEGVDDTKTDSSETSSEQDIVTAGTSEAASTEEATEAVTTEASDETKPSDQTGAATASKYDPSKQKLVALTFDDGPDTGNTKATTRIVDTMEKYGAHCTFFAVGEAIKEWFPTSCVDVMKKAVDIGCEYATHTYSHANLNKLDADAINSELRRSISAIEDITGQKVTLLRPPYGNASESVASAVDMPMIQWNVDTLDWDTKDAANTLKVVQENIKPGSVVLMHDIYRQTADAVENIVPWLQDNGYTLVTVTELFEAYGIPLEGHKQYYCSDLVK